MKQMKMKEKEAAKLDGQLIMLEEQKMMIESTQFDVGVVQNLQGAAHVVKDLNKQANVDDIAELQDELRDLQEDVAERQEFFADAAKDCQDELLDDLDELEAMAVEEE